MALLMAERIDRPPLSLFGDDADESAGRASVGGGPTLDDAIVEAWEGLTAHVAVACVVCDEGMLRPRAMAAGEHRARCDRCGAVLD